MLSGGGERSRDTTVSVPGGKAREKHGASCRPRALRWGQRQEGPRTSPALHCGGPDALASRDSLPRKQLAEPPRPLTLPPQERHSLPPPRGPRSGAEHRSEQTNPTEAAAGNGQSLTHATGQMAVSAAGPPEGALGGQADLSRGARRRTSPAALQDAREAGRDLGEHDREDAASPRAGHGGTAAAQGREPPWEAALLLCGEHGAAGSAG